METTAPPRMAWTVVLLLMLLLGIQTEARVSYAGHKLVRVVPKNQLQLLVLHDFQRRAVDGELDVWGHANGVDQAATIRVPPHHFSSFMEEMTSRGLDPSVIKSNLQDAIDKHLQDVALAAAQPASNAEDFNYGVYHNLSDIEAWMADMVTQYQETFDIELVDVTTSFENRTVKAIHFQTKGGQANKPIFWFHAAIHAREWITPATVIYMTKQLLGAYESDPDIKTEVDAWEWYVVPVLNVDGYQYTWTDDRLWRKTRTKHTLCYGTDPNRNWGVEWGGEGSSSNPCSDTYHGPEAFSEPCTAGVSAFLRGLGSRLKAFIDFHSYSQLWMTPWGYTHDPPEPEVFAQQDASSAVAVAALEAVHGTQYKHGTIADTIYVASGNVVDWVYGDLGVKYSATVELRDQGQSAFLLPPDQIVPSGEETLRGLLAFSQYARENP